MLSKIFILIPVLNESGNIPLLIDSLHHLCLELQNQYGVQIFLIDDGSQDDTAALATRVSGDVGINLEVIRHDVNQGPGKAFGTGFSHILPFLHENDLILTMEGDNTSRMNLVKQMLTRLSEGFDAVFASPYMYGGQILNTSAYRVFLSTVGNLLVKEVLGINGILTASSFFRIYRAKTITHLQTVYGPEILERTGFECMVEMTMKMINLQMTISEVPLVLDTKLRVGKSRMKITRTILGYFQLFQLKYKWKIQAEQRVTFNG